ncbi:MAG: hypothetical protein JJ902_23425 [Roseibium sp.]|nr:hypothetical protein [Roseibium sp.]
MKTRDITTAMLAGIFGLFVGLLLGAYHSGVDDGFRLWVGALSGWAAAIAAVAAAVLSIRWLKKQILQERLHNKKLTIDDKLEKHRTKGNALLSVFNAIEHMLEQTRRIQQNNDGNFETQIVNIRGPNGLVAIQARLNRLDDNYLNNAILVAERMMEFLRQYDDDPCGANFNRELRLTQELLVLVRDDYQQIVTWYEEEHDRLMAERDRIDDELAQVENAAR